MLLSEQRYVCLAVLEQDIVSLFNRLKDSGDDISLVKDTLLKISERALTGTCTRSYLAK